MCGRYTLSDPGDLVAELGVEGDADVLTARYNIAPTQPVPSVCLDRQGKRKLAPLRWGLIPFWAKDKSIGNKLINARSESVAEKPAFRSAFESRRCLLLADGFYEWKKVRAPDGAGSSKPARQPFYLHLPDHQAFTFAGLWEFWNKDPEDPTYSCTILTTRANDKVAELHDRMPVILEGASRDAWLDPEADGEALQTLLAPLPAERIEFFAVSRIVNSANNEVPACIEPVA
jgi:putative SOS response-associated peptidase YedK